METLDHAYPQIHSVQIHLDYSYAEKESKDEIKISEKLQLKNKKKLRHPLNKLYPNLSIDPQHLH